MILSLALHARRGKFKDHNVSSGMAWRPTIWMGTPGCATQRVGVAENGGVDNAAERQNRRIVAMYRIGQL